MLFLHNTHLHVLSSLCSTLHIRNGHIQEFCPMSADQAVLDVTALCCFEQMSTIACGPAGGNVGGTNDFGSSGNTGQMGSNTGGGVGGTNDFGSSGNPGSGSSNTGGGVGGTNDFGSSGNSGETGGGDSSAGTGRGGVGGTNDMGSAGNSGTL